MKGAYGEQVGERILHLNESVFKDTFQQMEPGGFFDQFDKLVPAARISTPLDYALTHEYGHMLQENRDRSGHRLLADNRILHANDPPSPYGASSAYEGYAEAFAEYHLSNGETDMPVAQELAKLDGWK